MHGQTARYTYKMCTNEKLCAIETTEPAIQIVVVSLNTNFSLRCSVEKFQRCTITLDHSASDFKKDHEHDQNEENGQIGYMHNIEICALKTTYACVCVCVWCLYSFLATLVTISVSLVMSSMVVVCLALTSIARVVSSTNKSFIWEVFLSKRASTW